MFTNGTPRANELRFSNWLSIFCFTLLVIEAAIMLLVWLLIVPPGTRDFVQKKTMISIDTNSTTNSAQFTITGVAGGSYTFSGPTTTVGDGALCQLIGTTAATCPFEANIAYVALTLLFPASGAPTGILYALSANGTTAAANAFNVPASTGGYFEETTLLGVGLPSNALVELVHLTGSPPSVILGTLTIAQF